MLHTDLQLGFTTYDTKVTAKSAALLALPLDKHPLSTLCCFETGSHLAQVDLVPVEDGFELLLSAPPTPLGLSSQAVFPFSA